MSEPKIVLVMIVKNESKIIERCFDSIRPIIDNIIISDTGSTDNTIEIIEKYMKKNNISGKVYKDEWKNFGYNRTKSITNAQEWLQDQNFDLVNTYLITIDADMILCSNHSFTKNKILERDLWSIQQKNSNMTYYNKRIFRSSLRISSIGVTHEHWTCDVKNNSDKLDELYINDIGDGGAKADKFERDIKLLTQGIIDEPTNERYYFYLAQSYSDSGKKMEAIDWYKKRIEAGGWIEEIFIAYLRIGDIYNYIGQKENAIYYWSLGYNYLPSRSETLYRIIRQYRIDGKNELALLYLRTALLIEYPLDQLLFIEYPIYQYLLLEELSICGYYTKEKTLAHIACEFLLLSKITPDYLKLQCRSNLFFFIPKIKSISINYSITKQFNYIIRDQTNNYWVVLDESLHVKKKYELLISPTCIKKHESDSKGLKDIRICTISGIFYGLAVTLEYGNYNHPSVVLCCFDKKDTDGNYHISNIFPTTFKDNKYQKNWTPFCDNDKLCVIYSHQPLTIVEIDKNSGETKIILSKESSLLYNLSYIRGSSLPIKLKNGLWIVLVNEIDKEKYFHRFLLYDSEWNLKEISISFYFSELFVEFCLDENNVILLFSKEDNTTEMIIFPLSTISWIPNDIKKFISVTI